MGTSYGILSVSGHGVALRTVAEATAWKHCLAILSTMQLRRVDISPTSFNAAIVSCGRRFMWQTALGLLFTHVDDLNASKSRRSHTGQSTECATAVLTALQVAHQWEQALALFTTWPLPESQVAVVVEACKRSHAWATTLALLERSTCRFPAMRACATASHWQAALSLFVQTEPGAVEARAASVSTILSALAKAMQWQRALRLFNETAGPAMVKKTSMKAQQDQKGNTKTDSWQNIQNRSLLRVLGAAHLWRSALLHLHWAGAQEDAWSLSAAIWACQRAGQQTAAQELLSQHFGSQLKSKRGRKELQLLEHLSKLILSDGQILFEIEDFAKANRWLKVAGGEKGRILEAVIQPGDTVLELGSYIGFTALRLALHGCDVVSIEADPLNAAVAREVVEMAGSHGPGQVKICVGRATDWLSSGLLDPVDVLLLDHRGTIYHEEQGSGDLRQDNETPLASSAALRQWATEVNRLCHESKFGSVDWEEFQGRLRPMLLDMLQDAAVEYVDHRKMNNESR
eukprot:Skav209037  [mRNA]  locus=scaffold2483:101739:104772:+ [translate_table: standard]